jgi:hypothetical protein
MEESERLICFSNPTVSELPDSNACGVGILPVTVSRSDLTKSKVFTYPCAL